MIENAGSDECCGSYPSFPEFGYLDAAAVVAAADDEVVVADAD